MTPFFVRESRRQLADVRLERAEKEAIAEQGPLVCKDARGSERDIQSLTCKR
ncbi:MAG: hypothetical protein J6Y35_06045 [Bacteroidales bacterium]|nr:hypothetical protein [Bacteroidales bacterium]